MTYAVVFFNRGVLKFHAGHNAAPALKQVADEQVCVWGGGGGGGGGSDFILPPNIIWQFSIYGVGI